MIRMVWAVLKHRLGILVNRKKVARIMQLKGWTLKQRQPRMRPRARGMKSVAENSNERWATYMTHINCGQDGWGHLALVIDCADREIIGWRLSHCAKAHVAEAAPEGFPITIASRMVSASCRTWDRWAGSSPSCPVNRIRGSSEMC